GHPFDLPANDEFIFFELENSLRGQAKQMSLIPGQTPRKMMGLKATDGVTGDRFEVFADGVQLFRPILLHHLPKTQNALKNPLVFIGRHEERFADKPLELSGGPLVFEAYLFWTPRIIPKQHRGVILRVGNASGALFDSTFLGYEISEQTRKEQVTAE